MTNAIVDALLVTLADVDGYADETFELDTAVKVIESAASILHEATTEERHLLERGRERAAQGGDEARITFFNNIGEYLGLDDDG